jgi:hypothetical protein
VTEPTPDPDAGDECEYWDFIVALDEDPETDEDESDYRNGWPPKA